MARITYLHTGGDLNRRSGGGHTFKLCTIFPHTLELLLAFRYDWENETILPGALRHFKRYQTCIVTFCTYYIAWILGDEGRGENGDCSRSLVRTVSTGCETPQCAASWMLLLYARDSSRWLLTPGPHFLSRGGPDILAPGPGLQQPDPPKSRINIFFLAVSLFVTPLLRDIYRQNDRTEAIRQIMLCCFEVGSITAGTQDGPRHMRHNVAFERWHL